MHVVINAQDFGQTGTAGASDGQHGISTGITTVAPVIVAAAIAGSFNGAMTGAKTKPITARIGSNRPSDHQIIMTSSMSLALPYDKPTAASSIGAEVPPTQATTSSCFDGLILRRAQHEDYFSSPEFVAISFFLILSPVEG